MEFLPNTTHNPDLDQLCYFVINDGMGINRANMYEGNFHLDFVAWGENASVLLTTNNDIVSKTLAEWESGNYYPYPDEKELQNEINNACEYVWCEYYDSMFDNILDNSFLTQHSGIAYYDENTFLMAKDSFERIVKEIAESTINEWLYYYDFDDTDY